ncbi:MAG: response regulator transcription factor [Elusimicrobia bacterium]|nr:response regulator transcription factor [Elusimicrobiota bacterium]
MPKNTVFLHATSAEELRRLSPALRARGYDPREAGEAELRAAGAPFVLDASRDPERALRLCRTLKSGPGGRSTPVLILFDETEPGALLAAFEAGADDCLSRPFDPRVLAAHVTAVWRRFEQGRPAPRALRAGPLSLDPASGQAALRGKPLELTATELRILELLMRRPGVTVLRATLLDGLRGAVKETFSRSVDTHIFNLRRKLGPAGRRWVVTAAGLGYRLDLPETGG